MLTLPEKLIASLKAGCACLVLLIATLALTSCGPKQLVVRPAEPLPPAKVTLPRAVMDPVEQPSWSR